MQASSRAEQLASFIEQQCAPDNNGWPVADKIDNATFEQIASSTQELLLLDEVTRECVRRLTAELNEARYRGFDILNRISVLQSEYADFGGALASVDMELHSSKIDTFKHLQRLKSMLWAYSATIVEIVRRREFSDFFLAKSHAVAELMAKLSEQDKEKRALHKSEVQGLLPWEVRGINSAPPILDIKTSGTASGSEQSVRLGREDIEKLLALLEEIETQIAQYGNNRPERSGIGSALARKSRGKNDLTEVKQNLKKMIDEMDRLEEHFAKLVERNLLRRDDGNGDSDSESDKERPNDTTRQDDPAMRRAHEAELAEMERLHQEAVDQLARERREKSLAKAQAEQAQAEVHNLKADGDTAEARRLNLVDEVTSLRKELEEHRRAELQSRQQADEDAERIHELESHLVDVQAELEDARAAQQDTANRIEGLLNQGTSAEKEVRKAQERINELTDQLAHARRECHEAKDALLEAEASKDKQIRTHRAEADGDRAILEEKLNGVEAELEQARAEQDHMARDISLMRQDLEIKQEAMDVMRGQLISADETHEKMIKETEAAKELAAEAELSRVAADRLHGDLIAQVRSWATQLLHVRGTVRRMPALSSKSAALAEERLASTQTKLTTSEELEKDGALAAFQSGEASGGNEQELLKVLRLVSPKDIHDETKTKLDTLVKLVKKWAKAYKTLKENYDKLKGERIAFNNFQVGDLAFFLPTREANSEKTWAAFNIGYPHYFLSAQSGQPEQLKNKQWLVAKITGIRSQVVDAKDESTNPYRLAPGIKFFMLDAQEYNSLLSSDTKSRASSGSISASFEERPATLGRSVSVPGPTSQARRMEREPSLPQDLDLTPANSPDLTRETLSPLYLSGPMSPAELRSEPQRSGLSHALQSASRSTSPALGRLTRNAVDGHENFAPAFDRSRGQGANAQADVVSKNIRNALAAEKIGNPFSSSPPASGFAGPKRSSIPSVSIPIEPKETKQQLNFARGIGTESRRQPSTASNTSTADRASLYSLSPPPTGAFSIPRTVKPMADLVAAVGSSYGSPRSASSQGEASLKSAAAQPVQRDSAGRASAAMTIGRSFASATPVQQSTETIRSSSTASQTVGRSNGRRLQSLSSQSGTSTLGNFFTSNKPPGSVSPSSNVVDLQPSASDLLRRFA